MGQITATPNLVAIKVVRHAGQWGLVLISSNKWRKLGPWSNLVFRTGITVAGTSIDLTLGFKSEIHFCKHGFAPITSVKEDYCYMNFFISHVTNIQKGRICFATFGRKDIWHRWNIGTQRDRHRHRHRHTHTIYGEWPLPDSSRPILR